MEREGPVEFEHLRIEHVSEWVKELTEERSCSYMELVADGPQKPSPALHISKGFPKYGASVSERVCIYVCVCVHEF